MVTPLASPFELFSRTVENRFIFSLFDLLLCGVILLLILRGRGSEHARGRTRLRLFLAFTALGASFAVAAVSAGSLLFLQRRIGVVSSLDPITHVLQGIGWLFIVASALARPARSRSPMRVREPPAPLLLALAPVAAAILPQAVTGTPMSAILALDIGNQCLVGLALMLFQSRPFDRRHFSTAALVCFFVAGLLHLGADALPARASIVSWNIEQFTWLLSLLAFALAVGEASRDLFDKVFVRLQIAFILLASVMTLVIIQTEKTDYVASVGTRSDQLAAFLRAQADYVYARHDALPAVVEEEDFVRRLTLGFGSLPELKMVRVTSGHQSATIYIDEAGAIRRLVEPRTLAGPPSPDPDDFFLIDSAPLMSLSSGGIELYGGREFLNQNIRRRIVLIFSLFTGMVGLSTMMIGLVVRGAGATIRRQAVEIEQTERQLMQASKLAAIGALAGGVAHEINNPATTILSRASFLLSQNDPPLSASDREDLTVIVGQAQRIARITGGLLTFSRPRALHLRPVSIDRVIDAALRAVNPSLVERAGVVRRTRPAHPATILADEDSLARALENIFRNALDAMPDGGTLDISVDRENESRLRLSIADTGTGIHEADLARIFDPFFTTKEVGKGTGLGLAIVHGIIQEHHGTIRVESRLHLGTRFVIVLPLEH